MSGDNRNKTGTQYSFSNNDIADTIKNIDYSAKKYTQKNFLLGFNLIDSGVIPNVAYGISRGGDEGVNAWAEILKFYGIKHLTATIRAKHYEEPHKTFKDKNIEVVEILGMTLPPEEIRKGSIVGIFDDINDTELSMEGVRQLFKIRNPEITEKNLISIYLINKLRENYTQPKEFKIVEHNYQLSSPKKREEIVKFEGKNMQFALDQIVVKNPADPNTWVHLPYEADRTDGKSSKISRKKLRQALGPEILYRFENPNFERISLVYGDEFADKMKQNLGARFNGGNITELKIPTTRNLPIYPDMQIFNGNKETSQKLLYWLDVLVNAYLFKLPTEKPE